jgi:LuxR family quorum-sensing system transcriptional regulator CciR
MSAAGKSNLKLMDGKFSAAHTWADLERLLLDFVEEVDLDYFALTWLPSREAPDSPEPLMLFLHNYPAAWMKKWRQFAVAGKLDPILVAIRQTSTPFLWADLGKFNPAEPHASQFMQMAREDGLGDGLTTPLHMANGAGGACSFAVRPGRVLPKQNELMLAGLFACSAADRLSRARPAKTSERPPRLTPRQIECTVLAARGLTEAAIGETLGISDETVKRHLKQARQAYNVSKTVQLIMRCLHDESITFASVFKPPSVSGAGAYQGLGR